MVKPSEMYAIFPAIAILVLSFRPVACSGSGSSNSSSTLQMLSQLSEKLLTKLNTHLGSPHRAKARGYDSWGYMDSYSHDLYGKSDYSWIIPLIIVVGFGTLLIPLMGALMTAMTSSSAINLTAGRRRRSVAEHQTNNPNTLVNSSANWSNVLETVENALAQFGKRFKQWQSK